MRAVKRATISLPSDLEERVEEFLASREPETSFTALVQAALRHYLDEWELIRRGYRPPRRPLSIEPAESGSGHSTTSIDHDRVLAESHEPSSD